MSQPRTKPARLLAALVTVSNFGGLLAGCSDPGLYWDRRETVALTGGDSVAANDATQMVDPWPPQSGNKNIAFNGEKMQAAVQRYRTGKVSQPTGSTDLQSNNQSGLTINQTTTNGGGGAPSPTATASQ
jgi:hypothetical protein